MTLFKWSEVAATNATADSTINWAEGQAPSSVNDSARAMMVAVAKYRDDMAGAIVTAGTSTAYTVTSFQGFGALSDLARQEIAFSPHTTNGNTVTLSVDGIGARPLRSAPGVELLAGTLVQGTPYIALYNSADGAFYLKAFYSSPYNVPFLCGFDSWDTVTPNSAFIFAQGQAISRSVYAAAFAKWATSFGAGDGSTTFNVPDKRGRVSVALDFGAGRLSIAGQIGQAGGSETHVLTNTELPSHTHTGTTGVESVPHNHNATVGLQSGLTASSGAGSVLGVLNSAIATGNENQQHTHSFTTDAFGGGAAHSILQPMIACNYIIRVI